MASDGAPKDITQVAAVQHYRHERLRMHAPPLPDGVVRRGNFPGSCTGMGLVQAYEQPWQSTLACSSRSTAWLLLQLQALALPNTDADQLQRSACCLSRGERLDRPILREGGFRWLALRLRTLWPDVATWQSNASSSQAVHLLSGKEAAAFCPSRPAPSSPPHYRTAPHTAWFWRE